MKHGWAVCCAGLLMAVSAVAEEAVVYRWKDHDGRVNYGNVPPSGVHAEAVDGGGRVTVVPALVVPASKISPQMTTPDSTARLERLERELETERQLRLDEREAGDARAKEIIRRKAECEERYREPCNDDGQPAGQRIIVVPARPPSGPHVPHAGEREDRRRDAAGQQPPQAERPARDVHGGAGSGPVRPMGPRGLDLPQPPSSGGVRPPTGMGVRSDPPGSRP